MKQFKTRHILLIIALCGLMSNCLGVLYNVAGLYFNSIAADFGVGRGDVSVAHTIASLGCAVGGILGAKAAKSGRFKRIVLICTCLFAGGTALLSMTHSLLPMYVLSAIRGIGAGTAGTVLVAITINNWFTGSVGLLTSLIFCSAGISGAILSPILSSVIERAGWRTGYLVMAAFIVLFYLPALLFPVGVRPEDAGFEPTMLGGSEKKKQVFVQPADGPLDPILFVLVLIYACIASCATSYIPHFSGIADSYGHTAAVGSAMVSSAMISNTFGKLAYGAVTDRIGIRKGVWIWGTLVAAGTLMMMRVHGTAALYVAAFLVGLCYSLSSVGTALLSRDMFNKENYAKAYPTINMLNTAANAAITSIIGFMYDASGNYNGALMLLLGGMLVLMACSTLAYARQKA